MRTAASSPRGQAVGIRGWATMVAVMRLHSEYEKIYGLLLNCDTNHLARFNRIRPGCYQHVRA